MKHKSSTIAKKSDFSIHIIDLTVCIVGFANAVTDPMVQAFKGFGTIKHTSRLGSNGFYGGYFCMALPAALFIRKYSYKVGILIGLALYACGALLFYPAAISEEFWFFCIGLYILTFGLAFLKPLQTPMHFQWGPKKQRHKD